MGRFIRVNGELYEEIEANQEDFRKVSNRYKQFVNRDPDKWTFDKGVTRGQKWVGIFSSSFDIGDDFSSVAIIYMDPDDYSENADDPRSSSIMTIVVDPEGKRRYTEKILDLLQQKGFGIRSMKKNIWAKRSLVRNTPLNKNDLKLLTKIIERVSD